MSTLIFFDDLNFQVVEFDAFYKVILCKTGFAVALKVCYGFIQPERPAQVKLHTYLVQSPKNLVGPGIRAVVSDTGILQHTVVFESSCP